VQCTGTRWLLSYRFSAIPTHSANKRPVYRAVLTVVTLHTPTAHWCGPLYRKGLFRVGVEAWSRSKQDQRTQYPVPKSLPSGNGMTCHIENQSTSFMQLGVHFGTFPITIVYGPTYTTLHQHTSLPFSVSSSKNLCCIDLNTSTGNKNKYHRLII
jgi:hypothetical protein